jgi:hypothetical protein
MNRKVRDKEQCKETIREAGELSQSEESREHENDNEDDVAEKISKYHKEKLFGKKFVKEVNTVDTEWSESIPRKRRLVDHPLFVASLDRTRITSRQAMHIVAPALQAAGIEVNDLVMSPSSIHRARQAARQSIAEKVKKPVSTINTPGSTF